MNQEDNKSSWRQVMLMQYQVFGTIAGLEVTALTVFVSFVKDNFIYREKFIFTVIAILLFLEIIGILWMINQERKLAYNKDLMQCFQENESNYRLILNAIMALTWLLILILLCVHIW